jgi:hypothetical protein
MSMLTFHHLVVGADMFDSNEGPRAPSGISKVIVGMMYGRRRYATGAVTQVVVDRLTVWSLQDKLMSGG